jgi:hypothetical protein
MELTMANRNQDRQSGSGRGYRGWDDNDDERDTAARSGNHDQDRERFGRDTGDQSGSTGRYAGYGEWGQGDYSGSGQGANTGQNRYGMTGYGGGRDQGYGQGNYGRSDQGQSGPGHGQSNYGSGRYDRERGGDSDDGRGGREADPGYGYGGSGGGGGSGRGWNEPSREREQYGSQRGWEGGGSPSGQRAGSGQSSGYAGPGYGYGGYGDTGRPSQGGSSRFGQGPGLHRGKGPKGYQRSDERLKEIISERLRDDPHVDASEITVNVSSGKVTLEGTVDSREAKNAAEDIVEHCGCEDVQNNLRVQRSTESSSSGGTAGRSAGASDGDREKGESARQRH